MLSLWGLKPIDGRELSSSDSRRRSKASRNSQAKEPQKVGNLESGHMMVAWPTDGERIRMCLQVAAPYQKLSGSMTDEVFSCQHQANHV